MANTPEGKVKDEIRKVLDALPDCWYFMPPASPYGRAGIPDFVGHVAGRFFAIEAKAEKGVLTALQRRQIARLRDTGAAVGVARTGADARSLLAPLLRTPEVPHD